MRRNKSDGLIGHNSNRIIRVKNNDFDYEIQTLTLILKISYQEASELLIENIAYGMDLKTASGYAIAIVDARREHAAILSSVQRDSSQGGTR